MRYYRIYGLGLGGHFVSLHEVERDSDELALADAQRLVKSGEFELWERGRFVARGRGAGTGPEPGGLAR